MGQEVSNFTKEHGITRKKSQAINVDMTVKAY